jgi:hypothetical protein
MAIPKTTAGTSPVRFNGSAQGLGEVYGHPVGGAATRADQHESDDTDTSDGEDAGTPVPLITTTKYAAASANRNANGGLNSTPAATIVHFAQA